MTNSVATGRLPAPETPELVEAVLLLLASRAALSIIPFRWLEPFFSIPVTGSEVRGEERSRARDGISRTIALAGRRLPVSTACFARALAATVMLRRAGIGSTLVYGVSRDARNALCGHVWVEADGVAVVGGDEAEGYAALARYPSGDARATGARDVPPREWKEPTFERFALKEAQRLLTDPEQASIPVSRELIGPPNGVRDDSTLDVADVTGLFGLPEIHDAAPRERELGQAGSILVVHVAGWTAFRRPIRSFLERSIGPRRFLLNFISTLPRRKDGTLDEGALDRLPVFDPEGDEFGLSGLPEYISVGGDPEPLLLTLPRIPVPRWNVQRIGSREEDQTGFSSPGPERPPSLLDGGELPEGTVLPDSLPGVLIRAAAGWPDRGTTFIGEDGSTFVESWPDLLWRSRRFASGLRSLGVGAGEPVVLPTTLSRDFFSAFWGSLLAGAVPIPIDDAARLGTDTAHPLRETCAALGGRGFVIRPSRTGGDIPSLPAGTRTGFFDELVQAPPLEELPFAPPEATAVVLFTSGSTGSPRGIRLSHRNVLGACAGSAAALGIGPEDVSLNWLPLSHVGALFRSIRDILSGARLVQAPTAFILGNPLRWLELSGRFGVTVTWAPNFAFAMLTRQLEALDGPRTWDLTRLRSVCSVGETVSLPTMRRLLAALRPSGLEPSAVHAAWGMTEAFSASVSRELLLRDLGPGGALPDLGRPVPGVRLRVVGPEGAVLPEGAPGELQLSGPLRAIGFLGGAGEGDPTFTDDGWLRTGDLAVIRNGRLAVTGRTKETILVNGLNVSPAELEALVESCEGVKPGSVALSSSAGPDGEAITVFVESDHPADDRAVRETLGSVRAALKGRGIDAERVVPIDAGLLPRTATGKLRRTELRTRIEAGEFDAWFRRADLVDESSHSVPAWLFHRVWVRREPSATLEPPGGASLLLGGDGESRARVRAMLAALGPVAEVAFASRFLEPSPLRFELDPTREEEWGKLAERLRALGLAPRRVVVLRSDSKALHPSFPSDLEEELRTGAGALLQLLKALGRKEAATPSTTVLVVSSGVQAVRPEDAVRPARSLWLGLVRCLPREEPGFDCRHVDGGGLDGEALAAVVWKELRSLPIEREVSYRDGVRLVPLLAPFSPPPGQAPLPLKHGGRYVVTGGLSGLGVELASLLLERLDARLLLIGRWRPHQGGVHAGRLDRLRALGTDVEYAALDVADGKEVGRTLREWAAGGPADGAFHLAGETPERLAREESPAGLRRAAQGKALGAAALDEALEAWPEAFLVSFGSALIEDGAATASAYVAANGCLAGIHHERLRRGRRSWLFSSSSWEGIGIWSRRDPGAERTGTGHLPMTPRQILGSLLVQLSAGPSHLLAGIDPDHPWFRSRLALPPRPVERRAPRESFRAAPGPDLAPLRTSTERRIARIWADRLDRNGLGSESDFFALGGDSVLAAEMLVAVHRELGVRVELNALLMARRLADLAALVDESREDGGARRLDACLVPLKAGEGLPALCLFHYAGGSLLPYRHLVDRLPAGRPAWGLQFPASVRSGLADLEIDALARDYAREIHEALGGGPVHLVGHSFGGQLALETARCLHRLGRRTGLVALLDTREPRMLSFNAAMSARFAHHLRALPERPAREWPPYLAARIRPLLAHLGFRLRARWPGLPSFSASTLRQESRLALHRHRSQRYDGEVVLLRAERQPRAEFQADATLGWYQAGIARLHVVPIHGDHLSFMEEPVVAEVARVLEDGMRDREGGGAPRLAARDARQGPPEESR